MSLPRLINRWLRSRRNPIFGALYALLVAGIVSDPAPETTTANWLASLLGFFLFISPISDIFMYKDRHRSKALAILSFFTCGTAGIIGQYLTSENLQRNEYPHHSREPLQTKKIKSQRHGRANPHLTSRWQNVNKKKMVGFLTVAAVTAGLYFVGENEIKKSESKGSEPKTTITTPDTTAPVKQAVETTTTAPISPQDSLAAMVKGMKLKSPPTISESTCGQFTFLVNSDGSHQFYKWNGTQWTVDKSGEETSLFKNNFMKVQMADATSDTVNDFIITLPTWDPLKSDPKPLSGAIFASVNCKWEWRTFKTTYGGSYYQLDNLSWDDSTKKIIAGDEITNMDSINYDGNRKTKQRFFTFDSKTREFILSNGTPQKKPTAETTPTTEPLFKPPAVALREAEFRCYTKLFDLLDTYNITNISPQNIGKTWFNNSDYKFRVGTTPREISEPIINACATAAKKRIAEVTYAAESSCSYVSRKELAKAYGVPTSSSRKQIASAVAKDFLPRFKSLVIAACLRKMQ